MKVSPGNPLPTRAVILPCGGKGTRLGLPYSKEIHAIGPATTLIDLTVDLLLTLDPQPLVVVVIRPEKLDVLTHLSRYAHDLSLAFVLQTSDGFTGAIRSARPLLRPSNTLLLLPDQAIEGSEHIEAAFRTLESGSAGVVIAHARSDVSSLRDEGALRTHKGRVVSMAEKPEDEAVRYDSAWCGLGFQSSRFESFIATLESLTPRGPADPATWNNSPLNNAPALLVDDYVDLGVWDRLLEFQQRDR